MSPRVQEKELILPALFVMSTNRGGAVTTSQLILSLTDILKPTGKDLDILSGRSDNYFSQKVRNLKSHHSLSKNGYAIETDNGFQITSLGRKFIRDNTPFMRYLLTAPFRTEDILDACSQPLVLPGRKLIPYDEVVSEGGSVIRMTQSRKRSSRLRDAAIEHFTNNGVLACECCGFVFSKHYPTSFRSDCIEIHHIRPIFQYQGISEQDTIDNALKNLMPVCPNCHRVIHKNNIRYDGIKSFSKQVQAFRSVI